jgi:hypothetical protein
MTDIKNAANDKGFLFVPQTAGVAFVMSKIEPANKFIIRNEGGLIVSFGADGEMEVGERYANSPDDAAVAFWSAMIAFWGGTASGFLESFMASRGYVKAGEQHDPLQEK